MNKSKIKMINVLKSAGMFPVNEHSLSANIDTKSFYRYLKLINRYKIINGTTTVPQRKVFNIYSTDIQLRFRIQKIISIFEMKLKAELHNTFFGSKKITVNKKSIIWENEFLCRDRKSRDSYHKAKKNFHWKQGIHDLKTQDYIDGMMFGHLIATYFALDGSKIIRDYRTLKEDEDTKLTVRSIRLLRNAIAHHSFLYEFSETVLLKDIKFMFNFVSFDKKEYKKIKDLVSNLYK